MEHTPKCIGMKMLVLGIVLILVRLYTTWDIWVVLGVLAVIKGLILLLMPNCCCDKKQCKPEKKK
jgi:uncharacterized protein YjeT (DUF2065 family)